MRTLFWILAVFALVAGVTMLARQNAGYVLLVMPPYRIEISLIFALILLLVGFVLTYGVLRLAAATLGLPGRVAAWRAARRSRKARETLLDALREFFAGRYARAEKAAVRAIELGEEPGFSAVLAARSAHELRAHDRRDGYLAQAAVLAPGDDAVRIVAEAALLLDQRRAQEALDVLKALPRKHTAALRLELKAQQLAKNWESVLVLAPQLEKRGVLDAEQALQIRRHAQAQLLEREAHEADALREAWKRIPSKERKDTRVAMAAARGFSAAGACSEAKTAIEQSLEERWDSELVALYAECEGSEALKRIERGERWLESHPNDAALLLTLGRLCAQQGLWGKAQSYLEASIAVEPTYGAHLAAARLQESLGNADAAREHYRKSLDLALARLQHVSASREKLYQKQDVMR